ncbi:methyl-CpG-binding domain-containing protein 13 [Iris pallida]|uniref:Methyl-CpG-binding domain-containing protein 13 n=1 Tax=Iris pallida TaxID=29817 RepID=A0AAX6F8J2_IRIPA|nr:methyl-CpG-binding domain-containing protein 13 [Iris pallida]
MAIGKEGVKEEKKRGRKRKYWKFASSPPDWLPDGWIMEVGVTQAGDTFKYYLSPVSEQKFRTKKEVLNYLSATKDDGYASEITSYSGVNRQFLIEQVEDSHEWLPPGWILEIRILMSGKNAGQKYKCYYDPFTGSRFYSKADVFCFLESGKLSSPIPKQKTPSSGTPYNILAQIDYSPEGLPHGWIKQMIFRKPSTKGRTFKKDLYYIDPGHRYTFRTIKAAIHFVSTGDVSKYASAIRRKRKHEICSLESKSPPPIPVRELESLETTARRSLFTEEAVKPNGEVATEVDNSRGKQLPPADHVSSGSGEKADSMNTSPDIERTKCKTRKVVEPTAENMLDTSKDAEKNNCNLLVLPSRASKQLDICEPKLAAENILDTSKDMEKNICKLLNLSTREPERSAGCETVPTAENMSETSKYVEKNRCELFVPPTPKSKQLDGCEHEPNKCKLLTLPTRASKGLAAYEPEPTTEYMLETSKHVELPSRASKQLDRCEAEPTVKNMSETPKHGEKNKQKLLTLPTRASKRLAGCEPERASENMSDTSKHVEKNRCKIFVLPSRGSKQLNGCEPEPTDMLETSKHAEKNKCKLLTLPTRASKRLAGCEPEPATQHTMEITKHAEKSKCKLLTLPTRASKRLAGCEPEPATQHAMEITKHAEKNKCKLLTLPTRASKRLAGCEPSTQRTMEVSKLVEKNKCNLLTLPTRASKRLAGCEPEPSTQHTMEITKHVEKNKCKLLTLPTRASKRLAGCEPEPSTQHTMEITKHAEKNKCKLLTLPTRASKRLAGREPEPTGQHLLGINKHVEKNKHKLLTLPIRASKRLAGWEPEPATENMLETSNHAERNKCKVLVLPSQAPGRLDGCELVPEVENILATTKLVEKNKSKLLTMPSRASKRLAGHEPDPVAELVIRRPSCKLMLNGGCDGQAKDPTHKFEETRLDVEPKYLDLSNNGYDGNKEQVLTENRTEDRPLPPPLFQFLDTMADPCIEFAVKTLMGDIPVVEETADATSTPSSSTNQGDLDQDKSCAMSEKPQKFEGDWKGHMSPGLNPLDMVDTPKSRFPLLSILEP